MVSVVAPQGVLYNVVEQPKSGHLIVHLLNYTATSSNGCPRDRTGRFQRGQSAHPGCPARTCAYRDFIASDDGSSGAFLEDLLDSGFREARHEAIIRIHLLLGRSA